MACSPGAGDVAQRAPVGDARLEQVSYHEWVATSPISPARAIARLPLTDTLTLGPHDADIPLDGVPQHTLVAGRGVAQLEGPDLSRMVPRYLPVELGASRIVIQGEPRRLIVMVYGEPDDPHGPDGFYPEDSTLVFEVELVRDKPTPVRMLAMDGIEVEGHRVGTVEVPLGHEGVTKLEVRALPDLATEESNLEIYFRDETNGAGSYPSGRFVTLIPLGENRHVLDFNRSRSPFCAYSTAYPCPVPWRGNGIEAPIEAGERYEGDDQIESSEL